MYARIAGRMLNACERNSHSVGAMICFGWWKVNCRIILNIGRSSLHLPTFGFVLNCPKMCIQAICFQQFGM